MIEESLELAQECKETTKCILYAIESIHKHVEEVQSDIHVLQSCPDKDIKKATEALHIRMNTIDVNTNKEFTSYATKYIDKTESIVRFLVLLTNAIQEIQRSEKEIQDNKAQSTTNIEYEVTNTIWKQKTHIGKTTNTEMKQDNVYIQVICIICIIYFFNTYIFLSFFFLVYG
jgi:hypothetical protein